MQTPSKSSTLNPYEHAAGSHSELLLSSLASEKISFLKMLCYKHIFTCIYLLLSYHLTLYNILESISMHWKTNAIAGVISCGGKSAMSGSSCETVFNLLYFGSLF